MNRIQLAKKAAPIAGLTHHQAKQAVDAIFGLMAEEIRLGRRVVINSFYTFGTKELRARQGRNPATGALVWVPAKRRPTAKPHPLLKKMVLETMEEGLYE